MEAQLDAVVDINPAIGPLDEPEKPKDQAVDHAEVKSEPKDEPIPKGVQKRIDRAVRQKYEAEARAKMLEERVAAMEARQTRQPQQHQNDDSEPTIDKFDNFDQYVAAKAEWIAERKINQTLTEREKKQAAAREATERQKTVDSWSKRLAQATADETMPDFEDTIGSSDAPITSAMQRAIMESEVGPRVAYYLAKNPDEAERIAGMSEQSVMRAIGRIEERLETQKKQVTPTNAPEPIKPVSTRTTVSKDPGKMSDAEYAKWRAQGRQRR